MADTSIPQHVAIICDGNRRWARAHGFEAFIGHRTALEKILEPLIDRANEIGIKYLTFWLFSTENWDRDRVEVEYLFNLFREFFDNHVTRLHEKNIRVKVIGDATKFADDIQERIIHGQELTKNNTGITLVMALNYGGRDELVRAVQKIVDQNNFEQAVLDQPKTSKKSNDKQTITAKLIAESLDTAGMPDPEFIIRTGGEKRLSGFMLWQSYFAELAFPDFTFPEFTPEKLDELLADFATRKRRFGK